MKYSLTAACLCFLLSTSAAAAPARNARLDDALVVTQKVEQQLKKKPVLSQSYARLMLKALRSEPQHPLRAYWVYALAHSGTPAAQVRSTLAPRDPLHAHFYWWRAMRQNTSHPAGQKASRLQSFCDPADVECLGSVETKRLPCDTIGELERHHAEPDQIRAVNPFEAFRDDRAHAEQGRPFGGPVA